MATPSDLLLTSLTSFYEKNPDKYEILYDVVNGKSALSLRIIDWFVTHYAKQNNVVYWVDDEHDTIYHAPVTGLQLRKFNVYLDTRAQLKSYTKLHFDPFRRHERISFLLDAKPFIRVIETTVGQLNFFRWALQNHLLDYIEAHLEDIEHHMTVCQRGGGSSSVPRSPPSKMPTSPLNTVMRAHCCIRFD